MGKINFMFFCNLYFNLWLTYTAFHLICPMLSTSQLSYHICNTGKVEVSDWPSILEFALKVLKIWQ